MHLRKLFSHESLITPVSGEVLDLAAMLDIPTNINEKDDHIYIKDPSLPLSIESFFTRRSTDVEVSFKVFSEILMDIKGGLTVLEAYKKQGYTFSY